MSVMRVQLEKIEHSRSHWTQMQFDYDETVNKLQESERLNELMTQDLANIKVGSLTHVFR